MSPRDTMESPALKMEFRVGLGNRRSESAYEHHLSHEFRRHQTVSMLRCLRDGTVLIHCGGETAQTCVQLIHAQIHRSNFLPCDDGCHTKNNASDPRRVRQHVAPGVRTGFVVYQHFFRSQASVKREQSLVLPTGVPCVPRRFFVLETYKAIVNYNGL